jgi:2-amino-4-hydroxy-6-hydroxymethyldihydropteridine diphosphokinase
MRYYLALGSNMGDRYMNIRKAVELLETIGTITSISSIYETEPVGMQDTGNFYNLVLSILSEHSPEKLLGIIKEFERRLGRDLTNSHYKPRTIDIDILLAENRVIKSETLTIPHEEMHHRGFVLIPLNEIAPDISHPILGKKISELLSALNTNEHIRRAGDFPLTP